MVLFKPDWEVTVKAINALAPQVDELCVVDNTPAADNSSHFRGFPNIHYIPLGENRGIAAAQNVGIQHFIDLAYDFVVFSDQDSTCPENLIDGLLNDFHLLKGNNYPIGLIGPAPINRKTGIPYENKKKYIDTFNLNNHTFIESESIISSFSLVPTINFIKTGLFFEELFIDFVENEWCFRLKNKLGLSAFISKRLKIEHELGYSKKFLGRNISISSPFRLYFQIRNFFWLKKLPYTTKAWKKQTSSKLILKLLYYPIIPRERVRYIQSIWHALRDGRNSKLKLK